MVNSWDALTMKTAGFVSHTIPTICVYSRNQGSNRFNPGSVWPLDALGGNSTAFLHCPMCRQKVCQKVRREPIEMDTCWNFLFRRPLQLWHFGPIFWRTLWQYVWRRKNANELPPWLSSTLEVLCQRYSSQSKNQRVARRGHVMCGGLPSSLSVVLQYLELGECRCNISLRGKTCK